MEKRYIHLINDEEKAIQFDVNYHNETIVLLKGKDVHILNTDHSSFPKEKDLLQKDNEITQWIKTINNEEQYDVILISEKVLKSQIDYIREIINYSKIYLFEFGDIFYPTQTMHKKDKIEIFYQTKPSILQVSGYPSQYTKRKIYHIFYDGLWSENRESLFE